MSKELNYGVYPTMLTPYKKDGSVDLDTAEKYVEWYFNKGCHGIFALCHSSESWDLTFEEKLSIAKLVYKKAKELDRNQAPFSYSTSTIPFSLIVIVIPSLT
jgi:4-hydroxy-tetrahydrodipicolinate synthase